MSAERRESHTGRRHEDAGRRDAERMNARMRRYAPRLAAAYLLLLSAFALATFLQGQRTGDLAAALRDASVSGCQRAQQQQVRANVSQLADWRVFRVVLHETLAAPPPPGQAAARRAFLKSLRQAVAAKTWTPLLDCERTLRRHGTRYLPLTPVPFNRRLPAARALRIR